MYRIREVDAFDEDVADVLVELHRLTFLDSAPLPDFEAGHWWLAWCCGRPVAFAGIVPSNAAPNSGYFCRVGVLKPHCGRGLQLRLMRAMERRARRNRWCCVVSDTTDNVISANNFIRAGYLLFQPRAPWGWSNTLYWQKAIKPVPSSIQGLGFVGRQALR